MTAPKAARKTGRGRVYVIDNATYWSVTTIIGNGLPKPAIAGWTARTIAEYAVANHKQLSGMLSSVRVTRDPDDRYSHLISDPDAVQGAVDWLKGAPYRESERKMNLGTAVHAHAEAYVLDSPIPAPDEQIANYLGSFQRFLDDLKPEYELAEATVYSPREKYAGTLDAIVTIGGRRLLIDYKTGKDIYPDVALQLAAYANAEFVLLPDGSSAPMPRVDGAAALHLREDGYSLIPVHIGPEVFLAFKYVREVMRWMEETSRGVLSQPVSSPEAIHALYPETVEAAA